MGFSEMRDDSTPMLRFRKDALIALTWLAAFAVAMAYVEAAVVAYLRLLYYPDGFSIEGAASLQCVPPGVLAIEIALHVGVRALGHLLLHLALRAAQVAFRPDDRRCAVPDSPAMDRTSTRAPPGFSSDDGRGCGHSHA